MKGHKHKPAMQVLGQARMPEPALEVKDFARILGISPGSPPKAENPKAHFGGNKLPLHLWPDTASALGCLALLDGALKYGRSNFRKAGSIQASIYYDAARRHLGRWFEGEEADPDSGLPHLAHVLACVAILVEAQTSGTLSDDRQVEGGYIELLDQITPHVARLKALHAGKNPKHYSIADNEVRYGGSEEG